MWCAASTRYSRGVVAAEVLIIIDGAVGAAWATGASVRGAGATARGAAGGVELQDASRAAVPSRAGSRERGVGRYFIQVLARCTQVARRANLQRQCHAAMMTLVTKSIVSLPRVSR